MRTERRHLWQRGSLAILLVAALALAGCGGDSSGGGGGGGGVNTTDNRDDTELDQVRQSAMTDAGMTQSGLTALDATSGEEKSLLIQSEALSATSQGISASSASRDLATALRVLTPQAPDSGEPLSRALKGALADELDSLAALARGVQSRDVLNVSHTINCPSSGTVDVSGRFETSSPGTQTGTVKYRITVSFNSCSDGTDTIWGEVIYAGSLTVTETSSGVFDYDYALTINGGIAVDQSGTQHAFIFRDTYDVVGTINTNDSTTTYDFNLTLMVDDGNQRIECSYTGTGGSGTPVSGTGTCTNTASTLGS